MLRISTLAVLSLFITSCGDSAGAGDDQPAFCADAYAALVSALLEPCVQDINCIEGKCRNGLCAEGCLEDDDCLGVGICDAQVCTYTCEDNTGACPGTMFVPGTGSDLNIRCNASGECESTFVCDR